MSRLDLNKRIVVITGGASGIGRATALRVDQRGATPVILDIDGEAAERLAQQIGGGALGLRADVTRRADLDSAFEQAARRLGGVDVVVANAGVEHSGAPVDACPPETYQRVLAINLGGVYDTVMSGLPYVIDRRGHVVAISSVAAFLVFPTMSAYSTSKAGVELLMRSVRIDLAATGVTAGVVHFGKVATDLVANFEADPVSARLEKLTPQWISKVVSPDEAAEALVRGIERRAPRTIFPARWGVAYALRGVLTPLMDQVLVRNREIQRVIQDSREEHRATTEALL